MDYINTFFTDTGLSKEITGSGKLSVFTHGNWSGTFAIEQLQSDGSWEQARIFSSDQDSNFALDVDIAKEITVRVNVFEFKKGSCGITVQFPLI